MANLKAVIGANYGDEGKGLMVNYFAKQAKERNESCIVVCTNGGAQRGHTVVHNGNRHVFHHFGSGALAGADTYLCKEFIVNPLIFSEEYTELKELGIEPKVYMSKWCMWSTPYDMIANQIIEESRGDEKHGSCGVGIWETMLRAKSSYYMSLPNLNIKSISHIRWYLKLVRDKYYRDRFKEYGITKIPDKWNEIWYSDNLVENYISDLQFMYEYVELTDFNILKEYDNVIFENGQGLLLDKSQHENHATPSRTGSDIANEFADALFPTEQMEVCYVTRTYLTRHGAGDFPQECDVKEINPDIEDKTNKKNEFQGKLRYGKIDLKELEERISNDVKKRGRNKMSIAITHINETDLNLKTIEGDVRINKWEFYDWLYISRAEENGTSALWIYDKKE